MDYIQDLDELVTFLEKTHPDLYRNISKEEFYKEIERIKSLPLTKNQFQLELMKLFAKVNDSHTTVNISTFNIPFKIKLLGDKFYIIDDYVNEISQFVGRYISSINGIPINEYIEKLGIYISYDTKAWKRTCCCDLLSNLAFLKMIEDDQQIVFNLINENDNSVISMNVDEESKKQRIKKEEKLTKKFDSQSSTMYIKYGTCGDTEDIKNSEFVQQTIDNLNESATKKVVVDLRDNRGGNSAFAIPLIHALRTYPDVDVLVDGGTFSSAFITAVNLKRYGARIVGSEMGMAQNHFGNCVKYELPSGIVVYCSSKEYVMHDGKLHGLSGEINLGEVTDVVYGKDGDGNSIHYQLPTDLLHSRNSYSLDTYLSFNSFEAYKSYNESIIKGKTIPRIEDSIVKDEDGSKQNFEWNSQQEKNTFEAKKVQNKEHLLEHPIEQGKAKENANIKDKPKVLTMQPVKNSNNGNGNNSNSSGFVSIITLIAILFAAIGLVSFLAYQIIVR